MKGKVVFVAAVLAFLFAIAGPAAADFTIVYPDGSEGIEIALGGGAHVALFLDIPGDFDLFTFHANSSGNPLTASLSGLTQGIAYWLDFRGITGAGRSRFDVYVKQTLGTGFFFVTTVDF